MVPNERLPYPEVTKFLKKHPTAKIVLVVDTHCLQETGGFVWQGSKDEVRACALWEVRKPEYDWGSPCAPLTMRL